MCNLEYTHPSEVGGVEELVARRPSESSNKAPGVTNEKSSMHEQNKAVAMSTGKRALKRLIKVGSKC